MTNIIKINLVLFASLLLLIPFISFAQSIALEVDAGSEVDVDVSTTTDIDVDAEVDLPPDVDVDVDTDTGVDVEVGTEAETETEARTETEANLRLNSLGVAVTSSAQVNSTEDLEIFSANASIRNNSVADVKISSEDETHNRVSVSYNHRVHLWGFIPTTIKSTTEVEARANGEAEVRSRLPWWSFMASGTSDIRSSIESRVSENAEVRANARADASASARARVAEAIIAELEAYASAEANASMGN